MADMTAEKGTYIFAIINIIIMTLCFAAELGLSVFLVYYVIRYNVRFDVGHAVWIVLVQTTLISLIFSAVLLHGTRKKIPSYLKAYFIHGMVLVAETMPVHIALRAAPNYMYFDLAADLAIIMGYVIYCPILYMIRRAYTKMEAVAGGLYAPKLLEENTIC